MLKYTHVATLYRSAATVRVNLSPFVPFRALKVVPTSFTTKNGVKNSGKERRRRAHSFENASESAVGRSSQFSTSWQRATKNNALRKEAAPRDTATLRFASRAAADEAALDADADADAAAESTPTIGDSTRAKPENTSMYMPRKNLRMANFNAKTEKKHSTKHTEDSEDVTAVPKKAAKRRKPADAPKSIRTAYVFYMMDQFPKLRDRFPNLPVPQIAVKVGEQWSALTDDERQPFDEAAAVDRARFAREKAAYEHAAPPKRALSAYTYFVKEQREKIVARDSSLSFAEIGRVLGRMWRSLSPSQRARYEQQARQDRARYSVQRLEFERSSAGADDSDKT